MFKKLRPFYGLTRMFHLCLLCRGAGEQLSLNLYVLLAKFLYCLPGFLRTRPHVGRMDGGPEVPT